MVAMRRYGALVPLLDGQLLLAGGTGRERVEERRAQLYDPRHARWQRAATLRRQRFEGAAVRLGDGGVMLAGGWSGDRPSDWPSYRLTGRRWRPNF